MNKATLMSLLGRCALTVLVTAGAIVLLSYSATFRMCRLVRGRRGVVHRWLTARLR